MTLSARAFHKIAIGLVHSSFAEILALPKHSNTHKQYFNWRDYLDDKMSSNSAFTLVKPIAAGLAIPGLYLVYKYHQYKEEKERMRDRRKITERDLQALNRKIEKLLQKLEKYDIVEPVSSKDEECVVCMSNRAAICTYPCGHQVICRRCFVKTIQVAVSQRLLPLRCVLCRAKILRLKQTGSLPPGAPSMAKTCRHHQEDSH